MIHLIWSYFRYFICTILITSKVQTWLGAYWPVALDRRSASVRAKTSFVMGPHRAREYLGKFILTSNNAAAFQKQLIIFHLRDQRKNLPRLTVIQRLITWSKLACIQINRHLKTTGTHKSTSWIALLLCYISLINRIWFSFNGDCISDGRTCTNYYHKVSCWGHVEMKWGELDATINVMKS